MGLHEPAVAGGMGRHRSGSQQSALAARTAFCHSLQRGISYFLLDNQINKARQHVAHREWCNRCCALRAGRCTGAFRNYFFRLAARNCGSRWPQQVAGRAALAAYWATPEPRTQQERVSPMAEVLLTHSNHLYSDRKQVAEDAALSAAANNAGGGRVAGARHSASRLFDSTLSMLRGEGFARRWSCTGRDWSWCAKTISISCPRCAWRAIANLHSGWRPRRASEASRSPRTAPMPPIMSGEYLERGIRFRVDRRSGRLRCSNSRKGQPRETIADWLIAERWVRSTQRAARASRRSGYASAARLGSGRHRAIPAGVDRGARLFFAEHGLQPRLPLSLQLVRQADLRQ